MDHPKPDAAAGEERVLVAEVAPGESGSRPPPWADPQSFLLIPMGVVGLFAARMASAGLWPTSAALGVWFLFYLNSGMVEHRQEELSAIYRGALVGVAGLCVALIASVEWMWLTWAMAIIAYAIAAVTTYIWRSFRG